MKVETKTAGLKSSFSTNKCDLLTIRLRKSLEVVAFLIDKGNENYGRTSKN